MSGGVAAPGVVPVVVRVEDEVGVPSQAVQGGRHGGGLAGVHNGRAPRRLPQQPHVVVLRAHASGVGSCRRPHPALPGSGLNQAALNRPSMPTMTMTNHN